MTTGVSWLDVRLGLRMLVKYPALTLVGGLGMAVAIAVSVGFFAFISAHAYPDIPLDEGHRIVALENRDLAVNNEDRRVLHDFVQWRQELRTVHDLAAFRPVRRNLILGDAPPEGVPVAEITAAGFRVARVAPLLGRYVVEEDERAGSPDVVVIGHDVWKSRFAGDPTVVGRTMRLGGTVHTIVGVMPEGFAFPIRHQYWTALRPTPLPRERRSGPGIFVFGRLAPGATLETAQAELSAVGQRTAAAHPETHAQIRPMVMPYTHSITDIQGTTTWMMVQMQMMMSILLVVVALNVAVLVYARTAARQGEIAVRAALGASRRRVVLQLFVEALVLSLGASVVGLGLAQVGFQLGNRIMEAEMGAPFWMDYGLRPATVLYTVGIAVLAAVIVGVLPGLQATGKRLQADLRQLGGGSTGMLRLGKTWTVLIVAQVAIAVAALPATVNMGWGEIRTATSRPTFPAEEFLMAEIAAEATADADGVPAGQADPALFGARLTELLRRLEADPAVAGATFSAELPDRDGPVEVEGVPAKSGAGHAVRANGVALDHLALYGARVRAGRGFEPGDLGAEDPTLAGTHAGQGAVIVDQAFVSQILGDAPALGRRIRFVTTEREEPEGSRTERSALPGGPTTSRWYEIVGVAENLQVNELDPTLVAPGVYYPVAPSQVRAASVAVRLRGTAPADFAPRLRALAVAVDPTLRIGTYSLEEYERQAQLALRLVALAIGLVLLSVFLLSAAGVYALASFTVTQRRREIGIRSALGAPPREVLRSVFGRVARQIAIGLALGLGGAALLETATGGELLGGHAGVLLPVFGALMGVVALLGALGPARRGLRIQPTEALRGEG